METKATFGADASLIRLILNVKMMLGILIREYQVNSQDTQ